MARNNNKLNAEQAQDAVNELLVTGETKTGVTFEEAFDILEGADADKMTELTAEYIKLQPNTEYNFLYHGTHETELDGKPSTVVNLQDKTGKKFISGAVVLVNSLKRVTVLPAFVKIITKGEIRTGNGKYIDMSVKVLPQAVR